MDLINWEDDFSLGIDEIDKQHRNLIDLSNKYLISEEAERPAPMINIFLV